MTFYSAAARLTTNQAGKEFFPHTPGQHAELLHPVKSKGQAVLVRNNDFGAGEAWLPYELDMVLYDVAGEQDAYLTQNRFTGTRRVVSQVHELSALYNDLDFYNVPDLAGRAPEVVLEMALERLRELGIPEPSLALCSGRGLCLVWLHTPVTRKELPTWNVCQNRLYKFLKPLGADRVAGDAARYFRLVGTRNGKNNALVRSLRDAGEIRRFDELAKALVPVAMPQVNGEAQTSPGADLYDLAVQRAARGYWRNPNGWSEATLWEGRLTDLQHLRQLWYGTRRMKDFRDRWLFIAATAISWLTVPDVLEREVLALAEEAGGWDEEWSRSRLQNILKRSRAAARGEKVMYKGFEWDPRYHFKNEAIIAWLEITPEEEREMVVLISPQEEHRRKLHRDREYQEKKRRAAGASSRAQYDQERTSAVKKKAAACRHLIHCGLSKEEAAIQMEVSKRTVERWCREA